MCVPAGPTEYVITTLNPTLPLESVSVPSVCLTAAVLSVGLLALWYLRKAGVHYRAHGEHRRKRIDELLVFGIRNSVASFRASACRLFMPFKFCPVSAEADER